MSKQGQQAFPVVRDRETSGNSTGGVAPPGYGAHDKEDHLWIIPKFAIHPITKRLEATAGLFYRMWPEHVSALLEMRDEGWPHIEIVRVAKEFWGRQQEAYQKDEALVQQYKEQSHSQRMQEGQNLQAGAAGLLPPEVAQQMEQGQEDPELQRSLSLMPTSEYRRALAEYKDKHSQGRRHGRRPPFTRSQRGSAMETMTRRQHRSWGRGGGFAVLTKADVTGEEVDTPKRLRDKREMSFTRKDTGVANAAFSAPSDSNVDHRGTS